MKSNSNSNMYHQTIPLIVFIYNKKRVRDIFEIQTANNVAENFDFKFKI